MKQSLCQEVMKYGENMEKRNSDISWRNFRELYAIFKVEIKFWYCMFHKKIANAMPWNIKKTHFHPVWNSQTVTELMQGLSGQTFLDLEY